MRFVQSSLFILASLMLLVGLSHFVKGFHGWQEARGMKQQYLEELRVLELERDHLKVRVEKLKTDEFTKEQLVREKLGYVKPGEIVYKIARSPQKTTSDNMLPLRSTSQIREWRNVRTGYTKKITEN